MTAQEKKDAKQHLVDAWIADLENGVAPWTKPWTCSGLGIGSCRPRNFESKRPYRGINVWTLLGAQMDGGFESSEWLTFSGVQRIGCQVKKGEHGTWILQPVPASFWTTQKNPDTGKDEKVKVEYWRFKGLKVFNLSQTTFEMPKPKKLTKKEQKAQEEARIAEAEAFLAAQGAKLSHGGDRAFYRPSTDSITLPPFEAFVDAGAYYSTSIHEHAHWTGHESRLARDLSGTFGTESYAQEELVAEMAAAFTCLDLGIQGTLQHREYIGSWVKKIKEDREALFQASKMAEQVVDYLTQNYEASKAKEEAA